jgi:hypothetical protein
MRKSYAEVHNGRTMSGSTLPSEESRKIVRYMMKVCGVMTLIALIDISGIYDLPFVKYETAGLLDWWCGLFFGAMIGIAWVHGWPKEAMKVLNLSPSLIHEEE